ncbi:Interface between microtubules and kinetochore protein [Castilleja foliolosa]|uniref:Interface between microtubules and kinetochore protein n=1 Tax=Castilleja foliolosa TaxID=1961234 RepID=A0ABD3EG18_9LAMI
MLTGRRVLDKNRPHGEQNLIEWARPYLAGKRKVLRVMDARIEGQYSPIGALKAATVAVRCLALEPKHRPTMIEVVKALEQLHDTESPKTEEVDHCKYRPASSRTTASYLRPLASPIAV